MKVAIQSNVSEQPYLEETELMTEVLQKPYDGETRQTLKNLYLSTSAVFSRR